MTITDTTRSKWLDVLSLPSDRIPRALILRGTRNLRTTCDEHRPFFYDVLDVGKPGSFFEDFFIGRRSGENIAYASVYGGAMATELVHVLCTLGLELVVHTGSCGACSDELAIGDCIEITTAVPADHASSAYIRHSGPVCSRSSFEDTPSGLRHVKGCSVSAFLAESRADLLRWHSQGIEVIDMETAAIFAVANHFAIDCAAFLYVSDQPISNTNVHFLDAGFSQVLSTANRKVREVSFGVIDRYLKLEKPGGQSIQNRQIT